jgi:hypothetical protein
MQIGIDSIQANILQSVRSDLVRETYASSFLLKINDETTMLLNVLECHVELFFAVAAARVRIQYNR